jgi:hypothetical protein
MAICQAVSAMLIPTVYKSVSFLSGPRLQEKNTVQVNLEHTVETVLNGLNASL